MNKETQIYSYDALKFIMAIMIVAIHTKAFQDVEFIRQLTAPFLSAAVPIFFILSSFFLFTKMDIYGYSWDIYKRFLKRLVILYMFWFIITLPITVYSKLYYLGYGIPKILLYVLRDFTLSYTFPGSWFLTALIIGTLIVFLLRHYFHIRPGILLFVAGLLYIYIKANSFLPECLQQPFFFVQKYIRKEVELTPLTGVIWCSVGCFLANEGMLSKVANVFGRKGCFFFLIIIYFIFIMLPQNLKYFINPLSVLFILLFTYTIKLYPSDIFMKFRILSILIYLIHFPMLGIVGVILPEGMLHICHFLCVLGATLFIAFVILWLEKYKLFHILKYSH